MQRPKNSERGSRIRALGIVLSSWHLFGSVKGDAVRIYRVKRTRGVGWSARPLTP
jgi:hypothetical protein